MEPFNYADWTVAVSTLLLVIVTGVLAWFTWLLYKATRTPSVVATIEPNGWAMMYLDLHVQNEGTATAFDVTLAFDPPLKRDRQGKPPLTAISLLRAGQKLSSNIAAYTELNDVKLFKLTIGWARKPGGRRECVSYTINLAYLDGMSNLGGDPLYQLAKEMKKLREDWQQVARGNRRIEIDSFDTADRKEEATELHRRYEEVMRDASEDPGEG